MSAYRCVAPNTPHGSVPASLLQSVITGKGPATATSPLDGIIDQVTIIAAADGSALGNPGPAGWAWYVDESTWAAGGWPHGTNNQGELMAVLDLLRQSEPLGEDLLVFCDSRYVIDSITKWMPGWKRKNWRKADGKPVLNLEVMKELDSAMQGRTVQFKWIKGHAGHELNEAADRLANGAAQAFQAGRSPSSGPGFTQSLPAGSSTPARTTETIPSDQGNHDLFSTYDNAQTVVTSSSKDSETSLAEQLLVLERELAIGRSPKGEKSTMETINPKWSSVAICGKISTIRDISDPVDCAIRDGTPLDIVAFTKPRHDLAILVVQVCTHPDTGSDCTVFQRSSVWSFADGQWSQVFQHTSFVV